jgi:1,6-anhydro-N-acetylmuramate kinase
MAAASGSSQNRRGESERRIFALMGRNALLGIPNHLPRCTGASRAAVLGEIVPGARNL